MKIRCPGCGAGLQIDRSQVGDHVPCPRCGTDLDMAAFERAAAQRQLAGQAAEQPALSAPPVARTWRVPALLGALGVAIAGAGLLLYLLSAKGVTPSQGPSAARADGTQQVLAPTTQPARADGQTAGPLGPEAGPADREKGAVSPAPEKTAQPLKPRKVVFWEVYTILPYVSIDGRRIQMGLSGVRDFPPTIRFYLPPGTHLVQAGETIEWLDVETDLFDDYLALHRAITDSDPERSRQALREQVGRLAEAFLTGREGLPFQLLGNYYLAESRRNPAAKAAFVEAARLKYVQAVRTDPGFAPSHLNLACILKEQGDLDLARKEAIAASILNFDNVFGIQGGVDSLLADLGVTQGSPALDIPWQSYAAETTKTPLDDRMVSYHTAILRYAAQASEKAKMWSNLGLYFAWSAGKERLAERYYHRSIQTLALEEDKTSRQQVLKIVSNNLSLLASGRGMPEKVEYEELARLYGQ